jgi:EAL and modified HD-GYP domain-containing signal transduction protein
MIHVGRQPIYDRAGDVVAYELLFRDAAEAVAASRRSARATSRVIVSAFTEFGLDQLAGARPCFINVTREFLVGELPVPFDPHRAVLEVVETVPVDDQVYAGVAALAERGFSIALDDFEWGGPAERLVPLASYVKLDMIQADPGALREAVHRCREHRHLRLVAERLETEEHLALARDLGFDLFQGHVLGRPHVVSRVRLSPARMTRLRLITALSAATVDFDEVVALVARDPTLSFRLLHATNAAASGLSTRVSSVHEAAVLLGLERIRQWVVLMLFSDLTDATEDQLAATMTRARFCHVLADRLGRPAATAFTVGLLSGLAELIAQPAGTVVAGLPLEETIVDALSTGDGTLGALLSAVLCYERGHVAEAARLVGLPPDDAEPLVAAYLAAVGWANRLVDEILPVS